MARSFRQTLVRAALTLAAGAAVLLVPAPAALAAAAGAGQSYGAGVPIPFSIFASDNAWNTPVDMAPVDANSADYIAHMAPGTGLHPDFGTRWEGAAIGIPYAVVPGDQKKVPVHFVEYPDESDPGPYPIPADAPVEGAGGPYADGDRHVLVLDADNQVLYELYHAVKQPDGSWNAGSGAVWDLKTNAQRPDGWTSADAAGLPMLPGLARYDEIVGEGVLDHALRFTVSETRAAYIYPASHYASVSTDPDLPPMGLRVRLKAGFDISGFSPDVQVILRGLKKYGMIVADNGADWYVGGAPDPRWNDETLHTLDQVLGSDFEVADTSALRPGGFSVSLGAPGAAREGTAWTRRGLFVDATGSLWTATVDYDDGAGPEVLALQAGNTFTLTHTWADDGPRDVRVVVSNEQGTSAEATLHVDVANVAPKVTAGGAARVAGRALFTRRGSFTDPGADTWRGTVAWGDGSASRPLVLAADKAFTLGHRFPARRGRSYTVVVTVRDDDGGRGTARFTVTVR